MTVNTTDITSGPYNGNDVVVDFDYDFRVENKNQLIVYETDDAGVETTLVVDTNYTVNNIGTDGGGTITRTAGALPSGYQWYIRSNYIETQDTAFASQGGFFPDVHESAFDKMTFLIQQISDRIQRSVKLPDSYSGAASAELPTPSSLKFVRWNFTGDALENTDGTTSVVPSDIPYSQGSTGSVVSDVETKLRESVSVKDFGATGDGVTDDLAALDLFINECVSTGAKGIITSGSYRVSGTFVLDANDLDIEFQSDAKIVPDSDVLVGMQIGGSQASRMNISRPAVDRGTLSTITENIGILFKEMNQSTVSDPESRFSKYNLKFEALSAGLAYNNIWNPQGIGGVRNIWLTGTSPGFTNENKFFGGRSFDGGSLETSLYIDGGTDCNHNLFDGLSLEGAGDQAIYCDGQGNTFVTPRTEGTWAEDDVVFGPNSQDNFVESTRFDLSITDYSSSGKNAWRTIRSGSKNISFLNNMIHRNDRHEGAHSTAAGSPIVITGATQASPVVLTATAHGLSSGAYVMVRKVVGMTELNAHAYRVGTTTANTLELLDPETGDNVDSTQFTAYTSGGYIMPGVPMQLIEDIFSSSGSSHLHDFYHGRDGSTSYVFRSIRDSDGLIRSSLTTDGRLTVARQLKNEQSSFSFEPLTLGSYRLWVDATGVLRIKNGAPTSDTDGTVVGTQT